MTLFEILKEIVTCGFYVLLIWLGMAVCYYAAKETFKDMF